MAENTSTEGQNNYSIELRKAEQEIKKSNVRIRVTYLVTVTYIVVAVGLIYYFVFMETMKDEAALGVFSGISSVTMAIIGFWFGTRNRPT